MIFSDSVTIKHGLTRDWQINCLRRPLRIALSLILPLVIVLPVTAQEPPAPEVAQEVAIDQEKTDGLDTPVVEHIAKPAPISYNPDNRRDPFLNLAPPKTVAKVEADTEIPRGPPPPGIAGTLIDQAGLEGIVFRSGGRRMAVVRGADRRAYFISEGDRLFDGYLKIIDDNSVVFVRERFMRSGSVLTQEVTKRLRQPLGIRYETSTLP